VNSHTPVSGTVAPEPQSTGLVSSRKQRTRAAIVAAASRVLAERGLAGMTVDQVLEAAGVARATFYAHFSDKNDVAREVVGEMWERASNIYTQFAELPALERQNIQAWLDAAYDRWREHNDQVVALLRDMPNEIATASARYLEQFAETVVGDGTRWPCERDVALCRARLLIVQLERALYDVARGAWRVDRETLVSSLTLSWVCALREP